MTRWRSLGSALVVIVGGGAVCWLAAAPRGERPRATRDQVVERVPARTTTATVGAGCFWGVEAGFRRVPGVVATAVGYEGGVAVGPTYREVTLGATGHAEVVRVTFDPDVVSYEALLETFWGCHDPTRPRDADERAGGEPHRSVIFYENEAQRLAAEASRDAQGRKRSRRVFTEILPATTFWRAEDYHQQYLEKTGQVCPAR